MKSLVNLYQRDKKNTIFFKEDNFLISLWNFIEIFLIKIVLCFYASVLFKYISDSEENIKNLNELKKKKIIETYLSFLVRFVIDKINEND